MINASLRRLKHVFNTESRHLLSNFLLMHDTPIQSQSTFFVSIINSRDFPFLSLSSSTSFSSSHLPFFPPHPSVHTHFNKKYTMDKLAPLLMNFIDQAARPPVQAKVTEQLDSTKSDLKSSLPTTVMNYLTGADGNGGSNALLSQLVSSLGPNFANKLSSVTNSTVDTASDGMDLLLTNGVLNIAKGVLTKSAGEEGQQGGGFNFDFLSQGKEGMVATTLAASAPVIKQVSENMGKKLSTHFPQEIGQALQKMVDQNGGAGGAMGMAAGLMSQFLGGHGNNNSNNSGSGDRAQGDDTGDGPIQQMLQSFLGPKILTLIQPYLQKFEAQMVRRRQGKKTKENQYFTRD